MRHQRREAPKHGVEREKFVFCTATTVEVEPMQIRGCICIWRSVMRWRCTSEESGSVSGRKQSQRERARFISEGRNSSSVLPPESGLHMHLEVGSAVPLHIGGERLGFRERDGTLEVEYALGREQAGVFPARHRRRCSIISLIQLPISMLCCNSEIESAIGGWSCWLVSFPPRKEERENISVKLSCTVLDGD